MARTTQQIIEDLLGKKDMQIAALTAALEDSTEKAEALQKALDIVKKDLEESESENTNLDSLYRESLKRGAPPEGAKWAEPRPFKEATG